MVSEDAGRTWEERSLPRFPPQPLLDLVIDPADADRLIAATERDLYQSGDAGRTWRYIAPFPGLLAWLGDTFVLIDASGRVFTTADRGGNWNQIGEIGGPPAALLARGERTLYAALHDGTIMVSDDAGRNWHVRSKP